MYQIFADSVCIYDDSVPEIYTYEATPWSRTVDLSAIDAVAGFITSAGKWNQESSSTATRSIFVEIPAGTVSFSVQRHTGNYFYSLLTSNTVVDGQTPSYATGYSGRIQTSGYQFVSVPSDARYVWVYTHTLSSDITPDEFIFSGSSVGATSKQKAISPELDLSEGSGGTLSFTLAPGCAGYNTVQRLTSTIYVKRDGVTIWIGRVMSEQEDLWNCRQISCESGWAFLNDTSPLESEILVPTISGILAAHNAVVAPNRQVFVGNIDGSYANAALESVSSGSKSLDLMNNFTSEFGGVFRVRYSSGSPVVDWLSNYVSPTGNEQTLIFNENLLDFTRSWDMSDFATCCYVKGADQEETDPNTEETYTISVGSGWIISDAAAQYGIIQKYLDYSDLTTQQECEDAARTYLATQQFAEMTLEVTAIDLHLLNPAVKSFDLLEQVHVQSPPHGLNGYFSVTGIKIPFDSPESTSYTLGFVNTAYVRRKKKLTEQTVDGMGDLSDDLDSAVDDLEAQDAELDGKIDAEIEDRINAIEETIHRMNAGTRGFITIDYSATLASEGSEESGEEQTQEGTDGIYITNKKLPIDDGMSIEARMDRAQVTRFWKWTMDGLGYSSDAGQSYDVAITMDGEILSEFIKLYGNLSVFQSKYGSLGGYLGYGNGANDQSIEGTTPGIHMYNTTGNVEMIVTDNGVRMSYANYHLYVDVNGVHVTGGGRNGTYLPCPMEINGDLHVNGNLIVDGTINGQ